MSRHVPVGDRSVISEKETASTHHVHNSGAEETQDGHSGGGTEGQKRTLNSTFSYRVYSLYRKTSILMSASVLVSVCVSFANALEAYSGSGIGF